MATITMYNSINVDDAFSPIFAAVATGTNSANTGSDPAAAWTARTLPSNTTWTGVCFGDTNLVAVASGGTVAATSPDGTTWTARTLSASKNWSAVAYGNGVFIAVSTGQNSTTISSNGGINWVNGGNLPGTDAWSSIAYGVIGATPTFVVVSSGTSTKAAYSQDNGTTWNYTSDLPSGDWRSVCFGNGRFVTVSYGSSVAATSTNGTSWTEQAISSSSNWRSIAYGNGAFVTVAYNTNKAATSADGTTGSWTDRTMSASANWNTVCYGISSTQGYKVFMAVAYGATTGAYSYDNGVTWVARALATSLNYVQVCFAPFPWNSGDTLVVQNNATITVNTNQTKFWKTITGTYGKLLITNDSTSTPINFYMGRNTGTTANTITPGSGLFTIDIQGAWISIGTGDNSSNQTFTIPYTEYVPCIEVETSTPGVYEVWNNITGAIGPYMELFGKDGLEYAGSGNRGNYFVQSANANPLAIISLTNTAGATYSRRITYDSNTNIQVGASITGTNIVAGTVVSKIISATELELSNPPTAGAPSGTMTCYNPSATSQFGNTLTVGDGVSGNKVPTGRNVRIANIMFSDLSPANLMQASHLLDGNIAVAAASPTYANTCMFGISYLSFAQASVVYFRHVGFSYKFALSECYNVDIDYLGTAATPTYWYYGAKWIIRDSRYAISTPFGYTAPTAGNQSVFSYITNAQISNWHDVVYSSGYFTGTTPLNQVDVSYSDDMVWENIRLVQLNCRRANYGLYLSARNYRNTFNNLQVYGAHPVYMLTSDDNNFNTVEYSLSMTKPVRSFASLMRIWGDPTNDFAPLVDGTKYYVKTRTYWSWMGRNAMDYYDSNEYSFTAFQGGWQFPDYVSIRPTETIARSVTLDWVRRAPEPATVLYEIYRSESAGFTERSPATRVFATVTAATVTAAQGVKVHSQSNGAVRIFTFAAAGKTITASGSTPGSFITDGFAISDTIYVNGSYNGNDGTYTITGLSATVITVSESLIDEVGTSNPLISISRQTSKSESGRALTVAAAKTITAPAGRSWTAVEGFAVGDVVDITGSRTFNNGTFTINAATATVLTMNEPMVAEVTPTSTSATTTRIFTFATSDDSLNVTGTVPGSFITDGHFIGDTVYCTSATNPGPYTITGLTATKMSFAENVTDESCAAGTVVYRRLILTLRAPTPGTRYYYRFRKYNFNSNAVLGCSTPGLFFTTNRAVASNVATLTTAVAHGFVVGQSVTVVGLGDASYNGTFTVTVVGSATTFSYALTHANESVADTLGRVYAQQLETTNRAVSGNVATLTTNTPHLFVVNQNIEVASMTDATYNGTFKVTSVPTSTTFTYALTHADEGTTADTNGRLYNRTLFSAVNITARQVTTPTSTSTISKTMTFSAAGKTIVLGTGSWITDGFSVWDTVTISGSGAGNNGTFTIKTLTAGTMTVVETLFDEVGDDSPVITVVLSGSNSNVARLTTVVAHGLVFGQTIKVFGVGASGYDGTYQIRAVPSTTTLEYTVSRATEASTVDNSGKVSNTNLDFDNVYYLSGFRFANNSTYITNIINNLYNSMFAPGVTITGRGIPAGTTVTSIDPSGREMTISNATTTSTDTLFATTFAVERRSVTSNVAMIVTSVDHNLEIGDKIKLSSMTDATYNGTFTITAVPSNRRIRFALTHADEAEIIDTAGLVTLFDLCLTIPAQTGLNIAGVACYPAGATVTSVEDSTMLSVSLRSDPAVATQYTSATLQTFNESDELTAVPNLYKNAMNYATYSVDFTNAAWTKSNITPTANSYQPPTDSTWATGSSLDQLAATGAGGTATLTVSGLKPSTQYCASFWVRADQTAAIPSGVAGSFAFGTTSTPFTATNDLKQYSAVYTTGGAETSTTIVITITTNGQVIHAGGVMVNLGSTPTGHIVTTSAATELCPCATPLSTIYSYARPTGSTGRSGNQGARVTVGTAPSGSYFSEIHVSPNAGFTPSDSTLFATTFSIANYHLSLSGASRNTFSDTTKLLGGGAAGTSPYYLTTSCVGNNFINADIDLEYCNTIATGVINIATACHSNFWHNIDFGKIKNYEVGTSIIYTQFANSMNSNRVQNIRCDNYDIAISNQSLNSKVKGIAGSRALPATTATTYAIGGTSDGMAAAYTAAYGTMFYEQYISATDGMLSIIMEDTLTTPKPYTVLSGTPTFTNTGLLYMANAGDSVEIVWPNKIYGVSGFKKLFPKLLGVDLGNVADQLDGLKIEYAIDLDAGSGYGSYKRLTATNLSGETVSASSGFYMKFKLTAFTFMKYGTVTNFFIQGETIRGLTSSATAVVDEIFDNGTTGTLILSSVNGLFIPTEVLVNNSTSQTRASNVATNGFALGPSYTSYIVALQIFTTVNQSILYPGLTKNLTLTGLKSNSEVRILLHGTTTELGGVESSGTSFTYNYVYAPNTVVDIVIHNTSYIYYRINNYTLENADVSLPIDQQLDRQYLNP